MDPRLMIQATQWLMIFSMVAGITRGQTVSLTGPSGVEEGGDVIFTCSASGINSPNFLWKDGDEIIFFGTSPFSQDEKYSNFDVSSDGMLSTLSIRALALEDEGSYRCGASGSLSDVINLIVEVQSNVTLTVNTTVVNNTVMYEATCDALGAKPEEDITWMIGNVTQSLGIVETDPNVSHHTLTDKRSVFTFPATKDNFKKTLECHVSGHQVSDFNWHKSIQLNIHESPAPDDIRVTFIIEGSTMTVSCDLNEPMGQPTPGVTNYYIFANDKLIPESTASVSYVTLSVPDVETVFSCMAGNYLGNATDAITFEPPAGHLLDQITDFMDGVPLAPMFSDMSGGEILSIIVVLVVIMLASIVINIAQWFNK